MQNGGMRKRCGKCKLNKPVSEFNKYKRSKDGLQHRCKLCHKADVRADFEKDPEKYRNRVREYALREPEKVARNSFRQQARLLGLDQDDMEAKFKAHNGLCDICQKPHHETLKRYRRLTIDHDHVTGEFRGFLCHRCNNGLGCFGDDPAELESAIRYLADHARKLAAAA